MKKILLLVVCLVLTLIPSTSMALTIDNKDVVSPIEAATIASQYQTLLSEKYNEWGKAYLEATVTYNGPDGKKTAYEYSLETNGKSIGFMIISATKNWVPLLECGEGLPPSYYLPDATKKAKKTGYLSEGTNTQPTFLYWSALSYCVQFSGKMEIENIAIHLPTGRVVKVPDDRVALQMESTKSKSLWEINRGVSLTSSGYISGVPAWYQTSYWGYPQCDVSGGVAPYPQCAGIAADPWADWDGCSCIAGSMVHGYWGSHGYPNLPHAAVDDDECLIDDNHHFMQTDYGGTTLPWNILEGVLVVFYNYGYYSFTVSDDWLVTWDDFPTLVNANHPAMLNMNDSPEYGDHSVTVVGYIEMGPPNNMITIHNTWDTSDHNIAYGAWGFGTFLTKATP
jgi:hypothetical protein